MKKALNRITAICLALILSIPAFVSKKVAYADETEFPPLDLELVGEIQKQFKTASDSIADPETLKKKIGEIAFKEIYKKIKPDSVALSDSQVVELLNLAQAGLNQDWDNFADKAAKYTLKHGVPDSLNNILENNTGIPSFAKAYDYAKKAIDIGIKLYDVFKEIDEGGTTEDILLRATDIFANVFSLAADAALGIPVIGPFVYMTLKVGIEALNMTKVIIQLNTQRFGSIFGAMAELDIYLNPGFFANIGVNLGHGKESVSKIKQLIDLEEILISMVNNARLYPALFVMNTSELADLKSSISSILGISLQEDITLSELLSLITDQLDDLLTKHNYVINAIKLAADADPSKHDEIVGIDYENYYGYRIAFNTTQEKPPFTAPTLESAYINNGQTTLVWIPVEDASAYEVWREGDSDYLAVYKDANNNAQYLTHVVGSEEEDTYFIRAFRDKEYKDSNHVKASKDIKEEILEWLQDQGDDSAGGVNENNAGEVEKGNNTSSPLIIDLDGNGVETLPLKQGVYFDHTGNGFNIITGWVAPTDALLVRDINGDGLINNGGELFGDYTLLKNGQRAANGFDALIELDSNGDALFDTNDTAWNELMLWIDADSDAYSDSSEFYSLEELDIASINLNYQQINIIDAHGNHHRQFSTATTAGEDFRDIVDVWFVRNARDSIATDQIPESDEIKELPDIRGFGTVYSLKQAMMRDSSGELKDLLIQFILEEDEAVRRNLVRDIIFGWTNTSDVVSALEALTTVDYTERGGPNSMKIINAAFDNFANVIFEHLMAQTHYLELYLNMNNMSEWDDPYFDMSGVGEKFLEILSEDPVYGEKLLITFVQNMYALSILDSVDVESLRNVVSVENPRYSMILDMSNRNIIFSAEGDNTIRGTNASNVFWLEKGNNTVYGSNGDNVYYLGKNFGTNTIIDNSGNNTIYFLADMPQVNVEVIPNTYDVEVTAVGGTGKMILKNFRQNATYTLYFADGNTFEMNLMELVPSDGIINIRTAKDLHDIRSNLLGNYRLMADIDLNGAAWTPIGTRTAPFEGNLDGNGYTIKNLNVNLPNQDYVGLVGYGKGEITNLTIEGASIKGRSYTGVLAGYSSGSITDCHVSNVALLNGSQYVGGLVGYSANSITDSTANDIETLTGSSTYVGGLVGYSTGAITNGKVEKIGTLSGYYYVGGFVGNSGGQIKDSSVNDIEVLKATYTSNAYLGGFAGVSGSGITNCTVTGIGELTGSGSYVGGFVGSNSGTIADSLLNDLAAVTGSGSYIGGYVGSNNGTIKNAYVTGAVKGNEYVGGFVGNMTGGTIEQCYATGDTDGSIYVGGFAGNISGANSVIRNCFSSGYTVHINIAAGFVGTITSGKVENCYSLASNANGFNSTGTATNSYFNNELLAKPSTKSEARTTADMGSQDTYTGWDFDTIWELDENNGYPTLRVLTAPAFNVRETVEIHTVEDFAIINEDLFGNYSLMADIDLEGIVWTPIGTNAKPFAGIFEGNGYTISNLSINLPNQNYVGLFGYNRGTIANLIIENAAVTGGSNCIGVLVGYSGGSITNCEVSNVSALIGGDRTGVIAGSNGNVMANCTVRDVISITGKNYTGVLSGYGGIVTDCEVSNITTLNGSQYVGGLVGYCASSITNSSVSGIDTITGSSYYVGGLVGKSDGAIKDATVSNIGTITGNSYQVGGLVGYSTNSITNGKVEKIGTLSGSYYVGGFAGNSEGQIKDSSVNDIEVLKTTSSNGYLGGFAGSSSSGITNCTVTDIGQLTGSGSYVGGFVGSNGGTITNSFLTGLSAVTGSGSNSNYIGGFAGRNSGTITDSLLSDLSSVKGSANYIGGYVGSNSGTIKNAYAASTVKGDQYVGGFVGSTTGGTIEQCYATGDTDGAIYVGGFAGNISGANSVIRNSFSLGNVTSVNNSAGFVGTIASGKVENCYSLASNANGFNSTGTATSSYFNNELLAKPSTKPEARTTDEMSRTDTYSGWDFDTVWELDENNGYPTLRVLTAPVFNVRGTMEIHSAEDFSKINNDRFGSYRLMADIDLTGVEWTPIGTVAAPFAGVFEGNGHTISNLQINLPNQECVGLFGYSRGMITNLTIEGATVTGKNYTGIIAGYSGGKITNCEVNGVTSLVGGDYTGVITGSSTSGLSDCVVSDVTSITGKSNTGIITGYSGGVITNCTVSDVAAVSGTTYVGGIVGQSSPGAAIMSAVLPVPARERLKTSR